MMIDSPENIYNLYTPEAFANPHPILAQLRGKMPVFKLSRVEMGSVPWLLTRYDDCVSLLKDERFTKDLLRRPGNEHLNRNDLMVQAASTINRHMITVDPPDHTRLRGLVHKAFTPRMIRELSGRIQQIGDDLLAKVKPQGKMDLVRDFAVPLPVTVIADLLGVPMSDQTKFREWTQAIVMDGMRSHDRDRTATAVLEFIMYFHDLFDTRRADPREDLISGLVQVEEAGDKLDAQELISMVFLLLVAGHETTVNLIGNGTLALLEHPDQMEKLWAHPDLMESAVEEMLRYNGPVGVSTMRWALEDLEMRGQPIAAGEMVMGSLLAANRDPAEFDNPDVFDITREPNRHIAFGSGIHYCLGAPLARLEGAIAIGAMLKQLPNLELDIEIPDIAWNETLLLNGMRSLPVKF
jgi:cytochrome P450